MAGIRRASSLEISTLIICPLSFILSWVLIVSVVVAQQNTNGSGSVTPSAASPSSDNGRLDLQVFTANELSTEYDTNEIAADARFKGKRFVVVGQVEAIKKGLLGGSFVVVKGKSLLRGVQCVFDEKANPTLATLVPGQNIGVIGTCDGLLGNVFMKNCTRITSFKAKGAAVRDEVHRFRTVDGMYLSDDELTTENKFNAMFPIARSETPDIGKGEDATTIIERQRREFESAENAKKAKAEEEAKYRTWTSVSGTFKTEAKLVSYAHGAVTIETREHKKVQVPVDKLSTADQEYVAKWRKSLNTSTPRATKK